MVDEATGETTCLYVNDGQSAAGYMPTPISSDSYEFVQYLGNYTNVTQDELVTIKYKSKDDLTRIGIICNADTGYAPTLYFTKTDTSLMTVDFGNGDVLTSSASGDVSFTTTTGYSGYDDFTPFEITVDCEGGSGSYYFTYLMNNTDADSAIEDIVQYIYMSDYIDTMPDNCLKYSNAQNIIVSNNENLLTIGGYVLRYAYALTSFSAPVATSIGGYVLRYASALTLIKFSTTTPPTVSDANFAINSPYDLKVEVPAGYLTTYQGWTNLTHLANRMVEV